MRLLVAIAAFPALAACAEAPSSRPAPFAAEPVIVACWDQEKDLVTRVPKGACRHEEIDRDQEAALAAERRRRVRGAIGEGAPDPVTGPRRLAGTGSGFFVGKTGEALTNEHVVRNCEMLTLTPAGGGKVPASVVAVDTARDLALLRATVPAAGVARFALYETAMPGAVVGYPAYGLPTIRPGLVEAGSPRAATIPSWPDSISFDGKIRRGHSGSALLDGAGNVVGIVKATHNTVAYAQRTGRLPDDEGFGTSGAAMQRFLRSNGVEPLPAADGAPLAPEALFEKARGFVAQVGCWR